MEERAYAYGDEQENVTIEDAVEVHVASMTGDSFDAFALTDEGENLTEIDGDSINLVSIEGDEIRAASEGSPESGGTNDYNELINKPQIEGVTLIGDKTYEELNLQRITNSELEDILVL